MGDFLQHVSVQRDHLQIKHTSKIANTYWVRLGLCRKGILILQ